MFLFSISGASICRCLIIAALLASSFLVVTLWALSMEFLRRILRLPGCQHSFYAVGTDGPAFTACIR